MARLKPEKVTAGDASALFSPCARVYVKNMELPSSAVTTPYYQSLFHVLNAINSTTYCTLSACFECFLFFFLQIKERAMIVAVTKARKNGGFSDGQGKSSSVFADEFGNQCRSRQGQRQTADGGHHGMGKTSGLLDCAAAVLRRRSEWCRCRGYTTRLSFHDGIPRTARGLPHNSRGNGVPLRSRSHRSRNRAQDVAVARHRIDCRRFAGEFRYGYTDSGARATNPWRGLAVRKINGGEQTPCCPRAQARCNGKMRGSQESRRSQAGSCGTGQAIARQTKGREIVSPGIATTRRAWSLDGVRQTLRTFCDSINAVGVITPYPLAPSPWGAT